MTVETAL